MNQEQIIQDTRDWVVKAVIGLNLCPFAKAVHVNDRIRYVVSEATEPEALLKDLARELLTLNRADPEEIDTTLVIHPNVLTDFLDFNDFLDAADALVEELKLDGILQIADFHPGYQFDGSAADDIANYSNRSPYPTLHILREDSIERAVESMPDTASIYESNLETLDKLGHEGWRQLGLKG
ncbi:hypothetical protein J2X20_001882 [Pelomonas saccharophila]|uniref:Peptidase n=1 Tax=Roseateles saccharophilus TaxID=304 RepID=A0ABU1YK60_ROSSA|nr:DUF1415 domain-containing protein [Roseateles saccharophilus]MDR7269253.1 hypothetical protein [Roseateles saccharophilus]